jgi:hypothetical protein
LLGKIEAEGQKQAQKQKEIAEVVAAGERMATFQGLVQVLD